MSSKGKQFGPAASASSVEGSARGTPQQSQLDFELEFFEAILQRYPEYIDVLRIHGNNLTLKGRFAEGLKLDRRLVQLRPHDPLAHYNLACSYSLLKKVDFALMALRKAIELGYRDFRYMRQDHDLDAVKADTRFRQLLREFDVR
jgi:Flp pilus assembly protein TadD